jgi:hypothetical protein
MWFRSFTRQDAWVYGSLLLAVLGGAAFVAVPFVRRDWLAEGIRSRIHRGQSMPEVLAAAEEAIVAQGVLAPGNSFMYYAVTVHCEDRSWWLLRDWGRDDRAEFRLHVAGSETRVTSSPDQTFRFAEANANGCTVDIQPGGIVFALGDDGRIAAIEPPRL